MRPDGDVVSAKDVAKEPCARRDGEPPEVARDSEVRVDPAHCGERREKHPSWPQDAVCLAHRGRNLVDELQRLCEDEAIEPFGLEVGSIREIGHDGGVRVRAVEVEDVDARHPRAEAPKVAVAADLEACPADVPPVLIEERLDVIAVDRQPAVEAPVPTDRGRAPETPKPDWTAQPASAELHRATISRRSTRRVAQSIRDLGRRAERRRDARPGDAVVLVYHRIAEPESDRWRLAVSPGHFDEHMAIVRERFHPIALDALGAALRRGTVPRRSVVVTFDDGYRDNLLARPVLEAYEVPATIFVVTGYTGTEEGFWWDELEQIARHAELTRSELDAAWRELREHPHGERRRELAAMRERVDLAPATTAPALTADELGDLVSGGLVEVGAHTATHPRLPGLPREEQLEEIVTSKQLLEEHLGRPVESLSYPHGAYDRTTLECVRAAGLQWACSGGQRSVTARTSALEIPRVHVDDVPGDQLAAMLEGRLRD